MKARSGREWFLFHAKARAEKLGRNCAVAVLSAVLAEGEAAVIKPEGTAWRMVAGVLPDDWAELKRFKQAQI